MPIVRVLGLQIVIASLTSVQQALFVRGFGFRHLFWVKLATAFVPGIFSIPLAILGFGPWALVAGSLAGALLNLILLWQRSAWRPQFIFDWVIAKHLIGFGIWVVGESLLGWLQVWGDNFVVGRFLGIDNLGVYQVGWNICAILFGVVLNPFLPVIYPTFSRLQDNTEALKSAFEKANRIVFMLALPMGVGLLMVGPLIESTFFGEKWQGLGMVISIIGFMFAVAWLVGLNPEVYRAMGRPEVNTKLAFVQVLYYIPAYLIASQYGFIPFVFVRLGVAMVANPMHVYLCVRMLGVSPWYIWRQGKLVMIPALFMAFSLVVMKMGITVVLSNLPDPVMLGILVATGVFVYVSTLWIINRQLLLQVMDLVKRGR
jgi:PST family polysaccharide transporter